MQHPRLQHGAQVLDEVATDLSQVAREVFSEAREYVDSATGRRVKLEGTPLGRQLEKARTQPLPATIRKKTGTGEGCLRCGTAKPSKAPACPVCGEPFSLVQTSGGLLFKAAILSDQGRVRANNEDEVRLWTEPGGLSCIGLVADGMGGEKAGEVASRTAAEAIARFLNQNVLTARRSIHPDVQLPLALSQALQAANSAVYNLANHNPALGQMGTTTTLALAWKDRAYLGHVGDSRAYLVAPHGAIWQITHDHSLVASLATFGQISAAEAEQHPQRNLLYRCVGQKSNVNVDTYTRRLAQGDRLVLCSDGLTRHVDQAEIATLVINQAAPEIACLELARLANSRGGEDNISIIIIQAS